VLANLPPTRKNKILDELSGKKLGEKYVRVSYKYGKFWFLSLKK